jgi:uncharacterized protein (TIGR02444 family)
MPDSPSDFWTFSLRIYTKPNIADICLELQDQFNVDVNLLLFMLWAASKGRLIHIQEIEQIAGRVQSWQKQVVTPLRLARRTLKSPADGWPARETELLRQRIKADELEAERLQQISMTGFLPVDKAGQPGTAAAAAKSNLNNYASILHITFPERHVFVLTEAACSER